MGQNGGRNSTNGERLKCDLNVTQPLCAFTNSKENFHMAHGQSFQKNHGGLRKRVLPNKHDWNMIPQGCRAQGVFLYAILGLAQDVNLIGTVLIHIQNFPMNSPLPNWPLELANGCYFDDCFPISNYFLLHSVQPTFTRQGTMPEIRQGKEGERKWERKINNMPSVASRKIKSLCINN